MDGNATYTRGDANVRYAFRGRRIGEKRDPPVRTRTWKHARADSRWKYRYPRGIGATGMHKQHRV